MTNIPNKIIKQATEIIISATNAYMNPIYVRDDVLTLAGAFPEEHVFKGAAATIADKLHRIENGSITGNPIENISGGWRLYTFGYRRNRIIPASEIRIVFKWQDERLYILNFGHRWMPASLFNLLRIEENEFRQRLVTADRYFAI